MMEEVIFNYVFHYNPMNKVWIAIPRDHYVEYWSNSRDKKYIRSSDIKTLITLIQKGDEFIKKIK